jgi:glyoxylase-like metal-dependent hydrolase (beta-lactamase superfamily II)
VEKALAKAGVDPLEIETILFTHLHNDHAANTSIFRNARLIFQKREWATLLDPLPIMKARKEYDPALVDELKSANCVKVHGDFELTDGIRCFLTPGHTPGCMSVAVNTARGIRILVGDHWPLYCMAFSQQDELMDMEGKRHKITPAPAVYGHFIPPSNLMYNYFDYYDSGYKILSMIPSDSPEFIVPGHEPLWYHRRLEPGFGLTHQIMKELNPSHAFKTEGWQHDRRGSVHKGKQHEGDSSFGDRSEPEQSSHKCGNHEK